MPLRPKFEAIIKGVCPVDERQFTLNLYFSTRRRTIFGLLNETAKCSGLKPFPSNFSNFES